MEFCPKCGTVMFPIDNCLECKCGYKKDLTSEEKSKYEVSQKVDAKDNVIIKGENIKTLPTTRALCPKCGNKFEASIPIPKGTWCGRCFKHLTNVYVENSRYGKN